MNVRLLMIKVWNRVGTAARMFPLFRGSLQPNNHERMWLCDRRRKKGAPPVVEGPASGAQPVVSQSDL